MAMSREPRQRKITKPPPPLDAGRLNELALGYVARFATSGGKLGDYLCRKLRERGWDGASPPDLGELVGRFADLGYIDDANYAKAKAGGLLRRGYGMRRVEQALHAAGIGEDDRVGARADEQAARLAALVMARKRRFGPFGQHGAPLDRALREKQVAAMLRAGHSLERARLLVDSARVEDAEAWANEGNDDNG